MDPVFQTVEVDEITECYRIIKRLGQGTYGQVLLAQDKLTGKPFAVKLVRKDRTSLRSFLAELCLSISLSEHPGFITTYPIFTDTMDYYAMTQELATAGTLHHLIIAEVGVPEEIVKRCATQISSALDFMHQRGLVHRDLKPDNVLLMDRDCHRVQLGDFGLTQCAGSLVTPMSHIIPYMSPELCDIQEDEFLILYPSVDTWAFGVLLFVILTGYFPWRRANNTDALYQVFGYWQDQLGSIPPPARWDHLSPAAVSMLSGLLTRDPSSRPTVLSVMNYINFPWIEGEGVCEVSTSPAEDPPQQQQFQYVIIQNQEGDASSLGMDANNPVMIFVGENATLTLGSEVEIP